MSVGPPDAGVLLVGAAVVFVAATTLIAARRRSRSAERPELTRALEERLAEALPAGRGTHLETPPTVRRIAVVDEGGADDADGPAAPTIVPVVRIDLETVDPPSENLRFEYVADVLEAIHPVLEARAERVRRYDVEFAFGPGGLLVDGECRRVSVPPAVADRSRDENYRAADLRRAVRRADGDPESPAALWDQCGPESDR